MNEKTIWFLLTFLFGFSQVFCNNENQVYLELIQKNENVLNFFNPDLSKYKELIRRIVRDKDRDLDKACEDSLISIYDGLEKKEAWALRCRSLNAVL